MKSRWISYEIHRILQITKDDLPFAPVLEITNTDERFFKRRNAKILSTYIWKPVLILNILNVLLRYGAAIMRLKNELYLTFYSV